MLAMQHSTAENGFCSVGSLCFQTWWSIFCLKKPNIQKKDTWIKIWKIKMKIKGTWIKYNQWSSSQFRPHTNPWRSSPWVPRRVDSSNEGCVCVIVNAAEGLKVNFCWGEETRGYLQGGSFLICSVTPMRTVLAQLGWAEGRNGRPVHGRRMGEDLASVFHDSQRVICSGHSLGGSEAYGLTVFLQLLSFLCSGVQRYIFPVFWAGVNCTETRKFDEESSGAIRIGCSCFGL